MKPKFEEYHVFIGWDPENMGNAFSVFSLANKKDFNDRIGVWYGTQEEAEKVAKDLNLNTLKRK